MLLQLNVTTSRRCLSSILILVIVYWHLVLVVNLRLYIWYGSYCWCFFNKTGTKQTSRLQVFSYDSFSKSHRSVTGLTCTFIFLAYNLYVLVYMTYTVYCSYMSDISDGCHNSTFARPQYKFVFCHIAI